ncbi:MAG: Rne/Rng family ribonuclease [Thermoguttaceae bacterium]
MLVNARQAEECRIAITEDNILEELYVERAGAENLVGNIYKGVIVNVEASIQAAFIDFGVGRNGFLHVSDVEPSYFDQVAHWNDPEVVRDRRYKEQQSRAAAAARSRGGDDFYSDRPRIKPPMQDIFQRGDEVLVQVIKEGIGNKGPTLSTYISIPGRYLVLMPSLGRVGVSRKIEDENVRRDLRRMMDEIAPPDGLGFIVRTAGADRTQEELAGDLEYLVRLWTVIARRIAKLPSPVGIYEESDMLIRTIRDVFTPEIDTIVVDDPQAYQRARDFLEVVMPNYDNRLKLYDGKEPLFHKFHLDDEIARINQRVVPLKQGGSIVIDQTEALVAIDVNSGNFRADGDAEETAYQMNLNAAKEIARQIRLRDLGGVIVNDFIDMRKEAHRRTVERTLRDAVRRDRARTKILRTSPFGLIEMTRQRIRPSLKRSVYQECPCCRGGGVVKSVESMSIEIMRVLTIVAQDTRVAKVRVTVTNEVAEWINNRKRDEILRLEDEGQMEVIIYGDESFWPEQLEMQCSDNNGRNVQ